MMASEGTDLVSLARLKPGRYPFLLESVAAGPDLARYDILFAFPGETLTLSADGGLVGPHAEAEPGQGFLNALDTWWKSGAGRPSERRSPFTGGWFLFLGYELAGEVEPTLSLSESPTLPIAFATRIPVAIIRDTHDDRIVVVAEPGYEKQRTLVEQDLAAIRREITGPGSLGIMSLREDDPETFLQAVRQAQAHIASGDIFQANLSRCWHAVTAEPVNPLDLYTRLRESNPAPFGGVVQGDGFALVSSSPERLVRRQGSRLDTRPIAGTLARDASAASDVSDEHELLDNPKERAEHIMLIDLERNDLGRISEGGSVQVDEYMVIESYSHVHHIVSNVTGIAREGLTPGELIRAVFPGGTITGCPKVRCMEIIHELEQRPRGAYTGSIGYLNHNGDCDLNILIRTMSVVGNQIEIAAGAGIVADSDPIRELEETRAKAKGLLLALGATP